MNRRPVISADKYIGEGRHLLDLPDNQLKIPEVVRRLVQQAVSGVEFQSVVSQTFAKCVIPLLKPAPDVRGVDISDKAEALGAFLDQLLYDAPYILLVLHSDHIDQIERFGVVLWQIDGNDGQVILQ